MLEMAEKGDAVYSQARRQLLEKLRSEKMLKTRGEEAAGGGQVKRRKSSHKPEVKEDGGGGRQTPGNPFCSPPQYRAKPSMYAPSHRDYTKCFAINITLIIISTSNGYIVIRIR